MNKKLIIGIIVILCVILGVGSYFLLSNENNKEDNNKVTEEESNNKIDTTNHKILVVYFSATNNTKEVALNIKNILNADTFEVTPKEAYTDDDLDYNNSNSRVVKEYNDENLRNIELTSTTVDNFDEYDTVFIGYPIWWGSAAWPINTFVKANDFTDKTVIPFCTSASSSIGESDKELFSLTNTGTWKDGKRFSSNASIDEIEEWLNSLF